jgi:DivIVA domain-containing protein
VVALMGAVAVVAAGRGGSLAESWDDRPDARVQADGPLTGQDLRRVRLTTAFRGYRMSEVDALLDRLAVELEDRDRATGSTAGAPVPGPDDSPDPQES